MTEVEVHMATYSLFATDHRHKLLTGSTNSIKTVVEVTSGKSHLINVRTSACDLSMSELQLLTLVQSLVHAFITTLAVAVLAVGLCDTQISTWTRQNQFTLPSDKATLISTVGTNLTLLQKSLTAQFCPTNQWEGVNVHIDFYDGLWKVYLPSSRVLLLLSSQTACCRQNQCCFS